VPLSLRKVQLVVWQVGYLTDNKQLRRALLRALALFLFAALLYSVRSILPPFLMGAFMAYILEPPVSFLVRKGLIRQRSIIFVYFLLISALALVLLCFVPEIIEDIKAIATEMPKIISAVQEYTSDPSAIMARYGLPKSVENSILRTLESIAQTLSSIGDKAVPYFMLSATALSYVILAPVIAYYILRDINRWRKDALLYLSKYPLPYVDLVRDIDQALGGFVRGQTIVCASVAALIAITAKLLGLKYSLLLGLIAGFGEFIPFFGPFIASLPLVISAFLKSPITGFWALGILILIQWADANLLVPNVTGPRVGLHPLLIIFALLAGGKLLGFWGVLLAIPLAGVVKALVTFAASFWPSHTSDEKKP
jgi:predicted PurR-regulated permease PerM